MDNLRLLLDNLTDLSNFDKMQIYWHQLPTDLYSVENGMELKVDLPGVDKKDIAININGPVLSISGLRMREEDNILEYRYAERFYGEFERNITLPFRPDPTMVSAQFRNGVLTIQIPEPNESNSGSIIID